MEALHLVLLLKFLFFVEVLLLVHMVNNHASGYEPTFKSCVLKENFGFNQN